MTRTVIRPGLALTEGSCWDVMAATADDAFDVTITDPPYSEKTHAGARTTVPSWRTRGDGAVETKKLIGFDSIDVPTFLKLCGELLRLTKRWIVMTCDWRHAAAAEDAFPDEFIRCGVFIKPDAAPQFTGDRPGTGWEAILMLHRRGKKRWNGGGHLAVWEAAVERNGSHPTAKPLSLWRKWVRQFSEPGELIFDPFAGGGVTGMAALLEGRRAELVELDPVHCGTMKTRLDRPYPPPPRRTARPATTC